MDTGGDLVGSFGRILRNVENLEFILLYRPADEYFAGAHLATDTFENFVDGHVGDTVEDEAVRTFLAVNAYQHNGGFEIRILQNFPRKQYGA